MKKNKKSSALDLGIHGYGVILFCMLLFFFYGSFVTDGINITAGFLAEKLGVQEGTVTSMNTIAGVVGFLFFIVLGQVNRRIGPRITAGLCLIIGAIAYAVTGNTTSIIVYTIAMCFVTGNIMSAVYIAGATLTAQWFPKKKGIAMGYTTMGLCFSSAFYVVIIARLIGKYQLGGGVIPPAAAACVLAVISFLFVRNTPQERGVNPDNVSDEEYQSEYDVKEEDPDGGWTTGKLLGTKEMWLSAICSAIPTMCTVGVMSRLIPRNMGLGMTLETALMIMTALSLLSIPGSFIVGLIDDKIGTKKTMILFCVWYIIALLLNFSDIRPCIYLSLCMFAITTGGGGNFTVSLPASVFGRQGFAKVNSVIFPIQGLITALNYTITGMIQNMTGSVRGSYLVFVGLCVLDIILLMTFDDKRFNRDFAAEHK